MLFKRGEHINNFLNLLQTSTQHKESMPESYSKLKERLEEDSQVRMENAKQKLT
jgi:hypothetical protein